MYIATYKHYNIQYVYDELHNTICNFSSIVSNSLGSDAINIDSDSTGTKYSWRE